MLGMDPGRGELPAFIGNRQTRRAINSIDRRKTRCEGSCGCSSCFSKDGGFGGFGSVAAEMGRVFNNPGFTAVAHSPGRSPLIDTTAQLAGAIAEAVIAKAPQAPLVCLGDITNAQFAREVGGVARNLPPSVIGSDRLKFALMLGYMGGASEASMGRKTHRAHAFVVSRDGLKQTIQQYKTRKTDGDSGLAGLGNTPEIQAKIAAEKCDQGITNTESHIKERCEACIRDACKNKARNAKIELVKRSYREAMGREPSNCAVNFYTQMRWCSQKTYVGVIKDNEPRRLAGGGPNPADTRDRNLFTNVADKAAKVVDVTSAIVDQLIDWITTAVEKISNLFCTVFKKIMGEKIGGFCCTILDVCLKLLSGTLKTFIALAGKIVEVVANLLKNLFSGKFKEAAFTFAKDLNEIVLLAVGGPLADIMGIPFTEGDAKKKGVDPATSFSGLAKKLTEREPLFVIVLALAIVNVVMTPTPMSIGAVVIAMASAIGIVYAPTLKKIPAYKDTPLDVIEKGTAIIIKMVAIVIMGIMKLTELYKKFKKASEDFLDKQKGVGGALQNAQAGAKGLWEKLGKSLSDAWEKVKKFNFKEAGEAVKGIAITLPIVIVALVADESSANDVKDMLKIAEDADKTVQEVKKEKSALDEEFKQATKRTTPQSQEAGKSAGKAAQSTVQPMTPATTAKAAAVKAATPPVTVPKAAVKPVAPANVVIPKTVAESVQKKPIGPALAMAGAGALIAGPIGAAGGLVLGLLASKKKA